MTAATYTPAELTLADAARRLREAVKDRSYRATPLGLRIARYYRWKKNEWGAADDTLRDYEPILAKLALYYADLDLQAFTPPAGTELLRECWDYHWGDKSGRTRGKVRSVWNDFFDWCVREEGLAGNPSRALASPKKRDVEIKTFSPSFVAAVVNGQSYLPDKLGCTLILRYGLRQGGVRNAQFKHFDFERRLLTIHTKGGRIYPLPIVDEAFWRELAAVQLEQRLDPDDFLIPWKTATRTLRAPKDEAEYTVMVGTSASGVGQPWWRDNDGRVVIGYRTDTRRWHDRKPTAKRMHLWWYACLTNAGLVEKGTTAGQNMHRGRHTAATEFLRSHHDLKLTQMLLGHKDIASTARYAQLDTTDLEAALRLTYGDGDTE